MSAFGRAIQGLVSLAALPLAAASALAALVALAGTFNPWFDIAAHFAPVWLAAGLAAAALSLFGLPDFPRRATLVYAAIALVASLVLIAPELLTKDPKVPADAPNQLRLVQFNALGGRNRDVAASLDWLLSTRADVIVMPEPGKALVQGLRQAGYHESCYDAENDYCGAAIFTRQTPLRRGVVRRNDTHTAIPLALAVLRGPDGGEIPVIGAHMVWPTEPRAQIRQRQRLGELIARAGDVDRVIVSGDFNSTPWSAARRQDDRAWGLRRRTRALFSWPTGRLNAPGQGLPLPILPIDHVYAGADWKTVSVERGPMLGSDHYPVLVVLALAPRGGLQVETGR